MLEHLFLKAVRDHGNMRGRHRRYAVTLVGMINSYLALQLNEHLVITDRIRRDLVHQFSHGIYS
jgi:TetR/AcrR family transcriptional regulator